MTLLFTPEELAGMSVEEINKKLVETFQYDDYRWQKERGLRTKYKKRAEGLQKVLYQCPACKTEFRMETEGTRLRCKACGKTWELNELNELTAEDGQTEFSHIPDWYEWERSNVRAEVEAGTYTSGELDVHVDSLPNAKGYVRLGNGKMVHDEKGFRVWGTDDQGMAFSMEIPAATQYSVHIEYEYLGKYGDCVDLNTLQDTWYVYPHGNDFAVTKMALATEEVYQKIRREENKKA
jgi:ribosomal protein L37AE/L43A